MKSLRQFLAVPFYVAVFMILCLAIVIELTGCAIAFCGGMVEGAE